ncbi:hypothetical protein L5M51_09290 [Shewanella sp. SM73]|uniref:hypothetical protein n=1 Tax=Shewanella TaxID=22 RepID=UPI0021DB2936|nr:hypothetical protein [Shewanella sp. SM73]MCU8029952.1 hypothetical protein [Shewanella sp. SM73]
MLKRRAMVICETTVRPMDGAVEHPRMDLLRVGNTIAKLSQQLSAVIAQKKSDKPNEFIAILLSCYGCIQRALNCA